MILLPFSRSGLITEVDAGGVGAAGSLVVQVHVLGEKAPVGGQVGELPLAQGAALGDLCRRAGAM